MIGQLPDAHGARRQRIRGFTMIEIVIVLVLLGVLAAIALPRFMNSEREARIAKLHSMEGALRSSIASAHAQARIENKLSGSQTITFDGAAVGLEAGYPEAHWNNSMRYVLRMDGINYTNTGVVCSAPFCGRGNQTSLPGVGSTSGRGIKIWPEGYEWADECAVYYINDEDGSPPRIGVIDGDC